MEEMEKSHSAFLQGAQQELKKEMAILQKKILIDTVRAHQKAPWTRQQIMAIISAQSVFELVRPKLDCAAV